LIYIAPYNTATGHRTPKIQLEDLGRDVSSHSRVWGTVPAEIEFGAFYTVKANRGPKFCR